MAQAPVKNVVDLASGRGITEPWRKYFKEVDSFLNGVKINSVTVTSSISLTTSYLGYVIKIDNGAAPVTITLPSVGASNINSWIRFIRLGSGPLGIRAADADTIESSEAGGLIRCDEGAERVLSNIELFLATATKWAILGGTGIWKVF